MKIVDLKAAPEYLPILAEWHQQEWATLNPGSSLDDRINKMQSYLSEEFIPSMFVALDGRLLGSAAIVKHDMDSRKELSPWVASVYVETEKRGQGVGPRMVEHVMNEAGKSGIKRLNLFTPDQELFYQNLGWQCLERTEYCNHQVTIMFVDLE